MLESVGIEPEAVLSIEETEDQPFGRLGLLNVDQQGRIFVTDNQQMHIAVYNSAGELLQTIGREGRGPGEFQRFSTVTVKNDTLWVFDVGSLRISAFVMNTDTTSEVQQPLNLENLVSGFPSQAYKAESGFIVASMSTVSGDGLQFIEVTLSHIDDHGEILNEEIVRYVEDEMIADQVGEDLIRYTPIPYNWRTTSQPGNSNIMYVGKSDSLRLEAYDITGERIKKIQNNIRYRPVTSSDKARFNSGDYAVNLTPDFHPAFLSFLVEDDKRFWFNLGEIEDEYFTWAALHSDGSLEASIQLPRRLRVQTIHSGKAYGIFTDEDGLQSIRVYELAPLN